MLQKITVENFALIEHLEIQFQAGFSTITGESGSGKSVLLKALALGLGERADKKALKNSEKRCVIELVFNFSDHLTVPGVVADYLENGLLEIRRVVNPKGHSKAAINDEPVTVEGLKILGEALVDIHSQHETLQLREEDFALHFLDMFGSLEPNTKSYKLDYELYLQALAEQRSLLKLMNQTEGELDFMRHQLQLFEGLDTNEDLESLEAEHQQLVHGESIEKSLMVMEQALLDMYEASGLLKSEQQSLVGKLTAAERWDKRLENLQLELEDLKEETRDVKMNLVSDPFRLQTLETILGQVYELQKKFGVETVGELAQIKTDLEQKLSQVDGFDFERQQAEKKVQAALEKLQQTGEILSAAREKVAANLEPLIVSQLERVKMGDSVLKLQRIDKDHFDEHGFESYQFVYAPHQNMSLQSLGRIASGGEMGRMMLILKSLLSGKMGISTLILDEIDTGVSGEVAERMAELMQEMSENMQIWGITHLPQVAAAGLNQYQVEKSSDDQNIYSGIKRLNESERIKMIAQMMSGAEVSEAALAQAQELLR